MTATTQPKALALLSGGLDSVVALAEALNNYNVVHTITADYGQRASTAEIKASKAVADYYELPHEVVLLPWLQRLLPRAMSPTEDKAMDPVADNKAQAPEQTVSVWVPNRNGVLLNMAAAFGEALGAAVVIYGANAEEGETFPDNTPAFRDRLNACFEFSTLSHVRVETPVGHLNKTDIVARGLELGAPLHRVWSCYEPGPVHCGVCPSCRLLKAAVASRGYSAIEFAT